MNTWHCIKLNTQHFRELLRGVMYSWLIHIRYVQNIMVCSNMRCSYTQSLYMSCCLVCFGRNKVRQPFIWLWDWWTGPPFTSSTSSRRTGKTQTAERRVENTFPSLFPPQLNMNERLFWPELFRSAGFEGSRAVAGMENWDRVFSK